MGQPARIAAGVNDQHPPAGKYITRIGCAAGSALPDFAGGQHAQHAQRRPAGANALAGGSATTMKRVRGDSRPASRRKANWRRIMAAWSSLLAVSTHTSQPPRAPAFNDARYFSSCCGAPAARRPHSPCSRLP